MVKHISQDYIAALASVTPEQWKGFAGPRYPELTTNELLKYAIGDIPSEAKQAKPSLSENKGATP